MALFYYEMWGAKVADTDIARTSSNLSPPTRFPKCILMTMARFLIHDSAGLHNSNVFPRSGPIRPLTACQFKQKGIFDSTDSY